MGARMSGADASGAYAPSTTSVDGASGVEDTTLEFQDLGDFALEDDTKFKAKPVSGSGSRGTLGEGDAGGVATSGSGSAGAPAAAGGGFLSSTFLHVDYYRPYFDVDTQDVVDRLKAAVLPIRASAFADATANNPDLWGPVWVCTSLVFISAAAANYARYVASGKSNGAEYAYDITKVATGSSIFYSYAAGAPILLYVLLRFFGGTTKLVHLWCLYGYSLAAFVPMCFLCIFPSEILRWVLVILATAVSGIFLSGNLWEILREAQVPVARQTAVVGTSVVIHVLIGLLLKVYFFGTWTI